jgi:diguanylate cyclase (GGDEF)-like protein
MTKPKNLFAGILLFIILDLSILGINYWIAHQIGEDALAINLSGRQRMLSQRITKALLALPLSKSQVDKTRTIEEFRDSAQMFDQTLSAFEHGGKAVGGDGKIVTLHRVSNKNTTIFISQAQQLWAPTRNRLQPYFASKAVIPEAVLADSQAEMLSNNLQLLKLMNNLTSAMEKDSRDQADALRIIQTVVFFLAMINFVMIVRRFHLLAHQAHQAKEQFSHLALHDSLTGLFNRRHLEDTIHNELNATHQENNPFTLLMLDLDGFKPINDSFGHDAGDTVLKVIAKRLSQLAHKNTVVARLGGDEFVLTSTDFKHESDVAQFCEQLLSVIHQPIFLDTAQVQVGVSIGVVFNPKKTNSKSDILRMADHAMYEAKKSGRSRYTFFKEA